MAARLRSRRRRRGIDWRAAALIALVSLVASAALFAWLAGGSQETAARPEALNGSAAPIAAATQAAAVPARPPRPPPPSYRLSPPYDIVDGATFGPEKTRRTRLSGIEVPPRDGICFDDGGKLWACGLQARAALNGIVRQRPIACDPVAPEVDGIIEARCRIEGNDVGQAMIALGFARTSERSGAEDRKAEATAREEKRGLWNGGWRLR